MEIVFRWEVYSSAYLGEVVLKLGLAIAFGGLIGWQRQLEHKPAGLRTHMLVSLGAALFTMTSVQIGTAQSEAVGRVIQGIAAGIGFLGAGEIVSRSQSTSGDIKIHGLTSAAAIWVSAALGVAAGLGLWLTGLVGSLFAYLILWAVKKIE
jgi:putative Mg2+ transporter-C (MgtC) family protein